MHNAYMVCSQIIAYIDDGALWNDHRWLVLLVMVTFRFDVLLLLCCSLSVFTVDLSAGVGTRTEVLGWGIRTIEEMRRRTWGTTLQRCVEGGQWESYRCILGMLSMSVWWMCYSVIYCAKGFEPLEALLWGVVKILLQISIWFLWF